jgi:SAM-dependent methyltransferase
MAALNLMKHIVRDYQQIIEIPSPPERFVGNSVAFKGIVQHVFAEPARPRQVLDIGFGMGRLGRHIKETAETAHWHVDGIDGFEDTCLNAPLFAEAIYRNVWHGLAQDLGAERLREYDLVCLFDVIEHLPAAQARELLATLLGALGPRARLVVSTPLWFWPQGQLMPGDLEEHLIGIPASSMMRLRPHLFHISSRYLVGTFVFGPESLERIERFQPIEDPAFDREAGEADLAGLGLKADDTLYVVTPPQPDAHTEPDPNSPLEGDDTMSANLPRVTVIINNRDLLEWPRRMVEKLERMPGVAEIVILDNGSSYRPLMAWYRTIPHRVLFLENLGHTAPWTSGVLDTIGTDLYVVSDPDLDLSALPDDTLPYLAGLLERHPALGKVGLSLATDGIPADSPYREHVAKYERLPQERATGPEGLIAMPVDTTFALHDRRVLREYKICGMRAPAPYVARHEPWHVVQPEGDFAYYLDHVEGRSSSYRDFTRHVKSDSVRGLYAAYAKEQGQKVSTKWDSYLDVYEDMFRPFKQEAVDLLEIGVQNGGSLEVWSRYFPRARTLTGCDINPRCAGLAYADPRVQVIVGNANEQATFQKIAARSPAFDIIVDDGSHRTNDVISSFLTYFPLLKPGGIYIAEDMHCAYWEAYGGGVLNDRSCAAFFRRLMDTVNSDHFREADNGSLFQAFLPRAQMNAFLAANPILSVGAHDSMFLVRKASPARPRGLGTEIIVGDIAIADDRVLHAREAMLKKAA